MDLMLEKTIGFLRIHGDPHGEKKGTSELPRVAMAQEFVASNSKLPTQLFEPRSMKLV